MVKVIGPLVVNKPDKIQTLKNDFQTKIVQEEIIFD